MTAVGAGAARSASQRAGILVMAGMFVALAIVPAAFLPQLYDDFTLIKQTGLFVAAALVLAGLAMDGFTLPVSPPVRAALTAWVAFLVISELLAIDPRGSALGVYQYRQGFLTQLCYVVLFAGGARLGSKGEHTRVALFVLVGGAVVAFYTVVQALGLDPVNWWTDTSARAIGTIGNANELAAFAVIALTGLPVVTARPGRFGLALPAGVATAVAFVVLESESRAGLAALVLFALLVPVSWWVARNPWRELRRPGSALATGFLVGGLLSLGAGSLGGTASRVQSGVTGADAGGSTRFALWQGTFEVIRAEPLHGAGPDGLYLAFPIHRPEDLGGAFESYDLVAQSSHNFALDTAANYGIPALLALLALVALSSANGVVATRKRATQATATVSAQPWVWSALAAYGALTLLNPVSLAPQAIFFVTVGMLAGEGRRAPARRKSALSPRVRLAAVAPAVVLAVFFAVRLPLADYRANQGWDAYAGRRFDSAATHYDSAASLMPLERHYATEHARALLAAGVDGPPSRLVDADEAFAQLDEDFGLAAGDALGQATARLGLKRPADLVVPLIDRALELNPHGMFMTGYTNRMRLAVEQGAVLKYSDRDRWVFVEPIELESTATAP